MGTRDKDYIKTGNGWLTSLANKASFVPWFGAPITFVAGVLDTMLESAGWLMRGKPLSAATAFTGGIASTATNLAGNLFGFNLVSGAITGRSLGSHVRKGTEMIAGGGLGLVGARPVVLRSYTAGIGSIGSAQQAPGYWANRVSQQAGRDPNQQWAEYVRAQQGEQLGMQR